MKKVFTTLALWLCCFIGFSQNFKDNYFPLRDYEPSKEFLKKVLSGYDSLRVAQTYTGHGQKKEVKDVFKDTKKELHELDTAGLLMRNDTITKYLQKLVDRIQQKNSMLAGRKFTVFTYRTDEPNATCWGAGVILVNLDLISKYSDEEELVSTLCHEMSHDIIGHMVKNVEERYAITQSEEFKKELKDIKAHEYGKFKKIEALITKFMKKYTKSKRVRELEADSLGLILYCNAGYPAYYAFEEMEKLDSVDNPAFINKIDYAKNFNTAAFPFKNGWLEEDDDETISGGNMAKEVPDSLKTHPDCPNRLIALKRIAKNMKYNPAKPATHNNSVYTFYRMKSFFEILAYNQDELNIGDAMYDVLQLSIMYPNNMYVKYSMVNCLYEIFASKTNHYMSQIVDMPDKSRNPNYNQLLIFLHNINSDVVKNLMLTYYKQNVENKTDNAFGEYVATLIRSINMTKKEQDKLLDEYKKKYNDKYYISLLKRRFNPKKT